MQQKAIRRQFDGREVELTNLDKVLFPADGYTKGDVVEYYLRVAPYLLPYVVDRPMSMHPFPNGIRADRFWHKDVPDYAPAWLRTFRYEAIEDKKVLRWPLINDLPSLAWVANRASIELHPWSSRYDRPEHPDWAIFDLDPSEPAGFEEVRVVARLLKVVLERLSLRSYLKTTGQRGLQIYVPIVREYTYSEVRSWVHDIARLILDVRPDIVTDEWDVDKRTGHVRIDYTQLVIGKTLVAPYAIRPKDGAPVSAPLDWAELDDPDLFAARWTIKTIFDRLDRKGDLFAGALTFDQHLPQLSDRSSPETSADDVDRKLDRYRRKRNFAVTAEPSGGASTEAKALRFCVQKHVATRLHYDFRLEKDGVLLSWAVPRGPSLDPRDKRMAVHVEDHPIEYMEFEGTIPAGEYGGGTVMLWDVGTYEELPGSKGNELKFRLFGQKLGGEFVLVRTGAEKQWLLIKKKDEAALQPVDDDLSVKTGRTLAQIAAEKNALWFSDMPAGSAEVDLTAAPLSPMPEFVRPMQPAPGDAAVSGPDWLFDVRWDGIRALAFVDSGGVRLVSGNGTDLVTTFPELTGLGREVDAQQTVLDGEVVAYGAAGAPDRALLDRRAAAASREETTRLQGETPVGFQAFDLLYLNGRDVRKLPLEQRRALLKRIATPRGFLFVAEPLEGDGAVILAAARGQGLPGIVAKHKRSSYEDGRTSKHWLRW